MSELGGFRPCKSRLSTWGEEALRGFFWGIASGHNPSIKRLPLGSKLYVRSQKPVGLTMLRREKPSSRSGQSGSSLRARQDIYDHRQAHTHSRTRPNSHLLLASLLNAWDLPLCRDLEHKNAAQGNYPSLQKLLNPKRPQLSQTPKPPNFRTQPKPWNCKPQNPKP